jgi:hypothetical protein
MPDMSLRRLVAVGLVLLAGVGYATAACACPFCSMQGQTLIGDVNQASMVLYGTFTNAQPGLDAGQGTTDLNIEAVIKKHEILGDKKVLTLPRYVPNKDPKVKFLVFCDVFKGKIDPYRGVPVQADSDMVKYLQGALEIKDKDISTRLRFYFDYLDDKEVEISNDAYKEFGNADYKDYKEMAKKLPADKIAKWLADPETPAFRYGLYASMLGHCGTAKHADLLRKLLDDPQKRISSGVDGMLAGYAMLKPKEGWEYVRGILKDPAKEFMLRYAALRAVRFFWDSRPDLLKKTELIKGASDLLNQSDIADLAIEDLRKWGCWDCCAEVLGLQAKETHNIPIIRRAILRYALSCPDKKAAEYVQQCRKRDAEMVKDAEELLKLETASQPVPNPTPPVLATKGAKVTDPGAQSKK